MDIKPLAGLTKTLRTLLKIDIALTAIALVAGYYDYYSYANLSPEIDPNVTMLPSDAVVGIIGIVQTIMILIVGITFLRWIYRTNKNLHALSGQEMEFTPGWSIGWYFIPIASLFKPYQAMKEIWQVSHKSESTSHSILGLWWTLWITTTALARISFKMNMRADDLDSYIAATVINLVTDGFDVIMDIVALMLVNQIWMAYSRNIVEQTDVPDDGFADTQTLRLD